MDGFHTLSKKPGVLLGVFPSGSGQSMPVPIYPTTIAPTGADDTSCDPSSPRLYDKGE